jgi:hypothetical protein
MDKDLWISMLRLVDEGSPEELQAKKDELLQALKRMRIGRGSVRSDVMRLVHLMDEELLSRHQRAERHKARR